MPERSPSLDEAAYLALETHASTKHEYVDGDLFPRASTSQRHNTIATNILVQLALGARGSGCRARGSDQRLRIEVGGRLLFYYPDVQLVCDPTDDDPNFVTRPCVIVEIESESTSAVDHREKLLAYRGIASVQAYLIVAQDRRLVLRHFRDERGAWWRAEERGSAQIPLPCIAGTLDLDAIYEGVL